MDATSSGRMRCDGEIPDLPPERQVLEVERAQPGDGEPPQLHAEQDHQQERQPEVRGREPDEHEDGHRLVEEGVLPGGRQDSQRHGECEHDDGLEQVQPQRDGHPLGDLLQHESSVRAVGPAEVQAHHAPEPAAELHVDGLVQAVELPQRLALGPGGPRLEVLLDDTGLPRRQLQHHEGEAQDAHQERNRDQQPPDEIAKHGDLSACSVAGTSGRTT